MAEHRTIIAVNIAGFTNREQADFLEARESMYEVLRTAFDESGIDFDTHHVEDRGDGALILMPPEVPRSTLVDRLPDRLLAALRRHNAARVAEAQLRLRVALHYGEASHDEIGWEGYAIDLVFRILDAPESRMPFAEFDQLIALIASDQFYADVIMPDATAAPESYRRISVTVGRSTVAAWLRRLGGSEGPDEQQPPDWWMVRTRGYGDRPATMDLLQRGAMIGALADLIQPPATDQADASGPTVIALDGPWGSGKTSLARLLVDQLPVAQPVAAKQVSPLRAFEADRALSGRDVILWDRMTMPPKDGTLIAAHFEPWAHQTSEQVWAGLTTTLLDSIGKALLPKRSPVADRYWFQRNLERIDRMRLRRSLRKGVRSPLLAVSVLALAVPIVAQLARSTETFRLAWVDVAGSNIAVLITVVMLLAAIGHTIFRYFTRPAADFLPEDLFVGPVPRGTSDEAVHDPYHNARSGDLYLAQHDVFDVLEDVKYPVVVFVDDLDRCTPRATAEVFEAINLFVTRTFPITRFVLCLDTTTVAAHLDDVYAALSGKMPHGDDPSPGWSFLRKLIQLPVTIPHIAADNVPDLLHNLLGEVLAEVPQQEAKGISVAAVAKLTSAVAQISAFAAGTAAKKIEHNSSVRELITERLQAQAPLSVREAKRMLTIWQYYVRVLIRLGEQTGLVEQARHLVILAEIISRWPAAQRALHRRVSGQHGLQLLAEAVGDDWTWAQTVRRLELPAIDGLRDLLQNYDGKDVAALAARLT